MVCGFLITAARMTSVKEVGYPSVSNYSKTNSISAMHHSSSCKSYSINFARACAYVILLLWISTEGKEYSDTFIFYLSAILTSSINVVALKFKVSSNLIISIYFKSYVFPKCDKDSWDSRTLTAGKI